MRIARAIRSFEYDREKGLFRDWLARIVLNEIRRLNKKQSRLVAACEELDKDSGVLESTWNDRFQQHIFSKTRNETKAST